MEVGRALHQRQEIDALDPGGALDRRDEPVQDRAELGTLGRRHLTEIQEMPPGFDDYRSCTGFLWRGVLGEEVLAFDDVAPRRPESRSSDPVFRPSCFRQMLQSGR